MQKRLHTIAGALVPLFAALLMIFSIGTVQPKAATVVPETPTNVTYELTNPTDGFAAGLVSVTIPDYAANVDYDIVMYWANDEGPLPGYTALQKIIVTGPTTVFAFQPGQLIPAGTTKLYVYIMHTESGTLCETPYILTLPAGAASEELPEPVGEFQVISDIHIGRNAAATSNFKKMLQDLKENANNSMGLFINGDIAHNGYESEYQLVQSMYDEAGSGLPPMFYVLGNHDVRNAPDEGGKDIDAVVERFCKYAFLPDGTHPTDTSYDFWLNGYHFIMLGTDVWTDPKCILNDDTVDWFKAALDENCDPNRPTFVFVHQSIMNTVAGCLDYQWTLGAVVDPTASLLISAYKEHPEAIVFNGHSHFELTSDYCMHPPTTEIPVNIFNTAACGYLNTEYRVADSWKAFDGSQGYYIRLYEDRLVLTGRDFIAGEWMPSAHFMVKFGDETRDAWTHLPKPEGHSHCVCGAEHKQIGILHAYESYETYTAANALPTPEANRTDFIYLTEDITLTETYVLEAGQSLNICLNGHTIHGAADIRMFLIPQQNEKAELIITDCSEAGTGTLDAHNTSDTPLGAVTATTATDGTAVAASAGGQIIKAVSSGNSYTRLRLFNVTLQNGWVSSRGGGAVDTGIPEALFYNCHVIDCGTNGSSANGGAFYCFGGRTANFYSCRIENCKTLGAKSNGGAIYPANALSVVTLHDTEITSCSSNVAGGALYANMGTLIIYEGTKITKCSAPKGGAGFFTYSGSNHSTLKIYGGLIGGSEEDKNWASNGHGGSFLIENANFFMNGGEISYGTAAHGGNLTLQTAAVGEMRSGEILYGKTSSASQNLGGGNVQLSSDDTSFTMTGGRIAYGTANTNGGNLTVRDGGTKFIMTGGVIEEGYATGAAAIAAGGNICVMRNGGLSAAPFGEVTIGGDAVIRNGSVNPDTGFGGNIGVTYNRPVTITGNAKVIGGEAKNGGNIGMNAGSLTVTGNALVAGGKAPETNGYGGNIGYLTNTVSVTLSENAKILNGSAYRGGNIGSGAGGVNLLIRDNAVVANGTAQTVGGNIFLVDNVNTTFTMTGGTVEDGKSVTSWGGNIVAFSIKSFTMSGGRLLDGDSSGACCIGISPNGTEKNLAFEISGDAIIAGDRGNGAGDGGLIRFISNTSVYTGEIKGNAVITGGIVSGSSSWGGNLYLGGPNSSYTGSDDCTMTISENVKIGTKLTIDKVEYAYDSAAESVTQTVVSKSYEGGEANSGGAIGVLNAHNVLTINGGTIADCVGLTNGNGIFVRNSSVIINGGTVGSIGTNLGTTPITVNGGYVGSVTTPANASATIVNGGYFVTEPESRIVAEGKLAVPGSYANPDTSDTTEYLFMITDAANVAVIDADAEINGASGISASITGSGNYLKGSSFTLTVSELSGFEFVGWYQDETLVSTDLSFTKEATEDAEYLAVFRLGDEYIIVTVRGSDFTFKAGDEEAQTGRTAGTYAVQKGTNVVLTYTGSKLLSSWVNESDKVLAEEAAYSFTPYMATFLQAKEFDTAGGTPVIFMTEYNQVYASMFVENCALSDVMPTTPYRLGRTAEWDLAEDEILALEGEVDQIVVHLVTSYRDDVYTIVVTSDGQSIFEKEVELGKGGRVVLPAENFLYVKLGDAIISYEPEFSLKGNAPMTLEAFYGDRPVIKESLVTMTIASGTTGAISFAASRVVTEDAAEIAEQGILFALTEVPEANFRKGEANVRAAVSTSKDKADVTTLNLNTSAPKTVYARAYVILTDGTEIYSDVVSATSL